VYFEQFNIRTLYPQACDLIEASPPSVSVNELSFKTDRKNNSKCNFRGYKITSVRSSVEVGRQERLNKYEGEGGMLFLNIWLYGRTLYT